MLRVVEAPLMGHPDKVCDLLVESVVDEYLRRDPLAKLDIQALGTSGMVMLGGAVEAKGDFDVAEVARQTYESIGYKDTLEIFVNVEKPKEETRRTARTGAQGSAIIYGYATKETREMLPLALVLAQSLARRVDDLRRRDERFTWLRPDGKVQVALENGRVTQVVLIVAHDEKMETPHLQTLLLKEAVEPVVGEIGSANILINPIGAFTTGGFAMNAGVSGRKVMSDLYGGLLPHGGVSLMGKDPLKPARAGTYMARYAARELVKEGAAPQVLITSVYALGISEPILLSAQGSDGKDLSPLLKQRFDFRPEAIVERFNLRRPLYARLANYGLFGNPNAPWEE